MKVEDAVGPIKLADAITNKVTSCFSKCRKTQSGDALKKCIIGCKLRLEETKLAIIADRIKRMEENNLQKAIPKRYENLKRLEAKSRKAIEDLNSALNSLE